MRHPSRRRNLALWVAGLGGVAMFAAFALIQRRDSGGVGMIEVLLGSLGLNAAIIGTLLAMAQHVRVARRYARLQRGEGVLMRWRIEPARWRLFRESAAALAKTAGALPNEMNLPPELPPEGAEGVITDDALCFGPEFEPLEKNAAFRLIGPVLEIRQRVPVNRYSTRLVVYQLPAPENAEADVGRVTERYLAQRAAESRSVKKMAWVALVVVVGILVGIVGWVLSVVKR